MEKFLSEHKNLINGLAILSVIGVGVITLLRFFPPWFHNASIIGDLLFNLSLAYLGAWVFNVLVVEIPRQRQRRRSRDHIKYRLEALASSAVEIKTNLEVSRRQWADLLEQPDPFPDGVSNNESLMLGFKDSGFTGVGVVERFYARKQRDFAQVDSLILMHFDIDLHIAAENMLTSAFFMLATSEAAWKSDENLRSLATSLDALSHEGSLLRRQIETSFADL